MKENEEPVCGHCLQWGRMVPASQCSTLQEEMKIYHELKAENEKLKAELKKHENHICGSQYRELGSTGTLTDQMGNIWKRT